MRKRSMPFSGGLFSREGLGRNFSLGSENSFLFGFSLDSEKSLFRGFSLDSESDSLLGFSDLRVGLFCSSSGVFPCARCAIADAMVSMG